MWAKNQTKDVSGMIAQTHSAYGGNLPLTGGHSALNSPANANRATIRRVSNLTSRSGSGLFSSLNFETTDADDTLDFSTNSPTTTETKSAQYSVPITDTSPTETYLFGQAPRFGGIFGLFGINKVGDSATAQVQQDEKSVAARKDGRRNPQQPGSGDSSGRQPENKTELNEILEKLTVTHGDFVAKGTQVMYVCVYVCV
jgi:hypothetical protein